MSRDGVESDPLVAGARELLEETGYVATRLTHLARLSPNPASHTNGVHIILADGATLQRAQNLDPTSTVGLLLIALARAKGLRSAINDRDRHGRHPLTN
jgi:8-oxo-dGTP pyrophosphatase MutT (NUDIX family)